MVFYYIFFWVWKRRDTALMSYCLAEPAANCWHVCVSACVWVNRQAGSRCFTSNLCLCWFTLLIYTLPVFGRILVAVVLRESTASVFRVINHSPKIEGTVLVWTEPLPITNCCYSWQALSISASSSKFTSVAVTIISTVNEYNVPEMHWLPLKFNVKHINYKSTFRVVNVANC